MLEMVEQTNSDDFPYYKLLIYNTNKNVYLTKYVNYKKVTLGRKKLAVKNHVILDDSTISRYHAKIFFSEKERQFCLRCYSKNGVFVDGAFYNHRSLSTQLNSASLIQMGRFLVYILFPSKSRRLETSRYDVNLRLDRLKDPFADLSEEMPLVGVDALLLSGPGSRESVSKMAFSARFESRIDGAFVRRFFEVYLEEGFLQWEEISKKVSFENAKVSPDESLTLALLATNELCRKSFLSGNFVDCKNLAIILREETANHGVLGPLENPRLVQTFVENIEYSESTANKTITMYHLNKLMATKNPEKVLGEAVNISAADGWSVQNDFDLLKGVRAHGVGAFAEIEADPRLSIREALAKLRESIEGELETDFLKERFSNLMTNLISHRHRVKAATFDAETVSGGDWTLKEHLQFVDVIQTFGEPNNWLDLSEVCPKLTKSKSAEDVKKRFDKLTAIADDLLKETPQNSQADNYFKLTRKGAQNLKKRIKLFKDIRKKMDCTDSKAILEKLSQFADKGKVPTWWEKPAFDFDLLRSCLEHGVSNREKIKADKRYCFHNFPHISFRGAQPFLQARFFALVRFVLSKEVPQIRRFVQPGDDRRALSPNSLISPRLLTPALSPSAAPQSQSEEPIPARAPQSGSLIVSNSLLVVRFGSPDLTRPAFSQNGCVLPVGFKSVRKYISFVNPDKNCKYFNEVLDGASKPVFRVTCEHCPNKPIELLHPTAIWQMINAKIKAAKPTKNVLTPVDGFERFGFKEPFVRSYVEKMVKSERSAQYRPLRANPGLGGFPPHFNARGVSSRLSRPSRPAGIFYGNAGNIPPPPRG